MLRVYGTDTRIFTVTTNNDDEAGFPLSSRVYTSFAQVTISAVLSIKTAIWNRRLSAIYHALVVPSSCKGETTIKTSGRFAGDNWGVAGQVRSLSYIFSENSCKLLWGYSIITRAYLGHQRAALQVVHIVRREVLVEYGVHLLGGVYCMMWRQNMHSNGINLRQTTLHALLERDCLCPRYFSGTEFPGDSAAAQVLGEAVSPSVKPLLNLDKFALLLILAAESKSWRHLFAYDIRADSSGMGCLLRSFYTCRLTHTFKMTRQWTGAPSLSFIKGVWSIWADLQSPMLWVVTRHLCVSRE